MSLTKTPIERQGRYDISSIELERAEVDGVRIEYGKYLNGDGSYVSYDDMLIESWREEINQIISKKHICSQPSNMEFLETLLFNGSYMPFLTRMNSLDHSQHKSLNAGKGKIYVNNKDKTECLTKRKNMLMQWLNDTEDPGKIYLYEWLKDDIILVA